MYEAFFKFRTRPFSPVPQVKNYFATEVCENARVTLSRAIERGEGPGLIIGAPGTGKTLLCQLLGEHFKNSLAVAFLTGGRLKSTQALLQQIHYELGLEYRGLDEGELRLSLIDFLEPSAEGPQGLLLIIDEAHTLPFRLLDEVRLITNLIRDGEPRVRVVLAGGPVLEERFASPKLQSFAQRIAARCYLEPMNRAETYGYVRAQLASAGGDPARLIDDEALQSVYRATDGIPRLVNQICDHALVLAALGGQAELSCEAIEEAWADLQQLPAPWTPGTVCEDGGSAIVEFGQLRDEGDSPDAIPFRHEERAASTIPLLRPVVGEEPSDEAIPATATPAKLTPAKPVAKKAPIALPEPEVDLDFPEFGDPFSEEFAEEELVLNQYAADVEIFADIPRVSSWEGRQIGAMLDTQRPQPPHIEPKAARSKPAQTPSARPQRTEMQVAAESEIGAADIGVADIGVADIGVADIGAAATTIPAFSPANDPVLPEDLEESEIGAAYSGPAAESVAIEWTLAASDRSKSASPSIKTPPALQGNVQQTPAAEVKPVALPPAERTKIVIEEPTPKRPPVAAKPRAGEFRQLFSKLRRG